MGFKKIKSPSVCSVDKKNQKMRISEKEGPSKPIAYVRPAWFNHEPSNDVTDASGILGRVRLADDEGIKNMDKSRNNNTMNWYRHEHDEEIVRPVYKDAVEVSRFNEAGEISNKMRPPGRPDWYSYSSELDLSAIPAKRVPRLTFPVAEKYMDRNRSGFAESWYSHEHEEIYQPPTFRISSQEGKDYASRAGKLSDNWNVIEPEKNPPPPQPLPKVSSDSAKEMIKKSGGEMTKVFDEEDNKNFKNEQRMPRIRPDGEINVQKNAKGSMRDIMQRPKSRALTSADKRAKLNALPPRITEDGRATFEKNKGGLNEVMTGYLDPPPGRPVRKRQDGPGMSRTRADNVGDLLRQKLSPISGKPEDLSISGIGVSHVRRNERHSNAVRDLIRHYGTHQAPKVRTRKLQRAANSTVGRLLRTESRTK